MHCNLQEIIILNKYVKRDRSSSQEGKTMSEGESRFFARFTTRQVSDLFSETSLIYGLSAFYQLENSFDQLNY